MAQDTFGPDHPKVATSLNNLAGLYQVLGRYAKAEALCKQALALWIKALGPDDPNVVTVLENLAELYIKLAKKAPSI